MEGFDDSWFGQNKHRLKLLPAINAGWEAHWVLSQRVVQESLVYTMGLRKMNHRLSLCDSAFK